MTVQSLRTVVGIDMSNAKRNLKTKNVSTANTFQVLRKWFVSCLAWQKPYLKKAIKFGSAFESRVSKRNQKHPFGHRIRPKKCVANNPPRGLPCRALRSHRTEFEPGSGLLSPSRCGGSAVFLECAFHYATTGHRKAFGKAVSSCFVSVHSNHIMPSLARLLHALCCHEKHKKWQRERRQKAVDPTFCGEGKYHSSFMVTLCALCRAHETRAPG